jgi:hypothetical protein
LKTKTVTIDETEHIIAPLSLGWFRANIATDQEKTATSNVDSMVAAIQTSLHRAGREVATATLLDELDFGSANALYKEVMSLSGLSLGEATPA